jgi:hypothetical protein
LRVGEREGAANALRWVLIDAPIRDEIKRRVEDLLIGMGVLEALSDNQGVDSNESLHPFFEFSVYISECATGTLHPKTKSRRKL